MTLGVGSTVWIFDQNHRVYTAPPPGRKHGTLIWREHWRPHTITGETSRSWIVTHSAWANSEEKIPKKNPPVWRYAFSEEEITQRAWVHNNRSALAELVGSSRDYAALRKVAEAIGYNQGERS